MPETAPRKLRSSFLVRLKQGSNGMPLMEAQIAWPLTCSVLPGSRMLREGPEPENCTAPAAPPSSNTRPAPRVPSKQVKANTLPATNLRASSAVMLPAIAGIATDAANTAPNTKRATMEYSDKLSADDRQTPLPAAYHTNRGNNGARMLAKSERPQEIFTTIRPRTCPAKTFAPASMTPSRP